MKAGAIIKVPGSAEQLAAAENGPQADSLQVQDSLPGIFAGSRPRVVKREVYRVAVFRPHAVQPQQEALVEFEVVAVGLVG